jgi:hypothetical protein
MITGAQKVIVMEQDPNLSETMSEYIDGRGLSVAPDQDAATARANIRPSPVLLVGDPYVQLELTGGVDFYQRPVEAVGHLCDYARANHGDSAAVVIATALLPLNWDDFERSTFPSPEGQIRMIAGVPVIEKGVDSMALITSTLNGVLSVRNGFSRQIAHLAANFLAEAGLVCLAVESALDEGNRNLALSEFSEFASSADLRLADIERFSPQLASNKYIFRQGQLGGVLPVTDSVTIVKEDRLIDSQYLERAVGATYVATQLKDQFALIFGGLRSSELAHLSSAQLRVRAARFRDDITELEAVIKGTYRNWTKKT